jgi:hypothetical protein
VKYAAELGRRHKAEPGVCKPECGLRLLYSPSEATAGVGRSYSLLASDLKAGRNRGGTNILPTQIHPITLPPTPADQSGPTRSARCAFSASIWISSATRIIYSEHLVPLPSHLTRPKDACDYQHSHCKACPLRNSLGTTRAIDLVLEGLRARCICQSSLTADRLAFHGHFSSPLDLTLPLCAPPCTYRSYHFQHAPST